MASTFGRNFRVTTFGESHGGAVGVVVDGCPPRLAIDIREIQGALDRRKPGQSRITTQRREDDVVEILSGVEDGLALGTPIAMVVRNRDVRPGDYDEMRRKYRPSHADFTYHQKYGIRSKSGGGRASARETVGRVAAGAVAAALNRSLGIEVVAWVEQVGDLRVPEGSIDVSALRVADVEQNPVRCPHEDTATAFFERIDRARMDGDSLGGIISAVARGAPAGLGEPIFDKLEADLAKALMSIPAAKGFEVGSGFGGVTMSGSTHNDAFIRRADGGIGTRTNYSGGIQGGISNGEPITMRVAFKPTATILREQDTVDVDGNPTTLKGRGRHDACVLPRAVPIVEAMIDLVLADHTLRQRGQRGH